MSEDMMIKNLERIAISLESSATALRLSKAPDIWQVEDIAKWIKKSYAHTRDRVVKLHGFPAPIAAGGWFADEVIEWFRLNRGKLDKSV